MSPCLSQIALLSMLFAPATTPTDLPHYQTPYYDVYSDLDPHSLVSLFPRIDLLPRVYQREMGNLIHPVHKRFPLVIDCDLAGYRAAGGPDKSAGYFDGTKLLIYAAAGQADARTWHTVQHEAFHQFAHVAGNTLPIWLDEGLAEYFGEGVFTGDDMTLGLIPEWRRQRVVATLRAGRFRPLAALLQMTPQDWNASITIENYDQVWSLAQFLMHDGGHRQLLHRFIARSATQPIAPAIDQLERDWSQWWQQLPPNATDREYARAVVAVLTSFLARAAAQRQAFGSFDEFLAVASRHQLQSSDHDVLPDELLDEAIASLRQRVADGATFTLTAPPSAKLLSEVHCRLKDGTSLVGRFDLKNGQFSNVRVSVE